MISQQSGSIVLTASVNGLEAGAGYAHYVAAKHGVLGLMRNTALELGQFGLGGGISYRLPWSPGSFDALPHRVDENGHVDGLIQHVIRAGGQCGG